MSSISHEMVIYPWMGVVRITWHIFFNFGAPIISLESVKLQALQISCADWYWVSLYVWYSRLLPKGIKLCSGHVISQPLTSFSLKNNWSLLSLCFTLSLGSTPFISSSTLFWYKFLHFLLTCYFNHHFFLFWFTTLHIHNSLSLSLLA